MMTNPHLISLTKSLATLFEAGNIPNFVLAEHQQNVIEVDDTDGRRYTVTVASSFVPTPDDTQCSHPNHPLFPDDCLIRARIAEYNKAADAETELDDDGDDDEIPPDPENFDGGFGNGSYFQQAMHKDD